VANELIAALHPYPENLVLAHDPGILLIPGTSSLGHLEDNIAAANVRLDPGTMNGLTAPAPAD
jgi:pyridoxine 4-dehydrogenase